MEESPNQTFIIYLLMASAVPLVMGYHKFYDNGYLYLRKTAMKGILHLAPVVGVILGDAIATGLPVTGSGRYDLVPSAFDTQTNRGRWERPLPL